MPVGRNSVYGPPTTPIYDPEPIKGNRKVYMAGATSLPPFSVTGFVDGTGESPAYPIRTEGVLTRCVVTVENTGGTSVDFDILVNGVVAASLTASLTGAHSYVVSIPVAFNDLLSAAITDFGSGELYNLLIVLRP
jgi:hypothetical protein